jgi:hypothetical protein
VRASVALVVLGCAASGCAAERRVEPQAVDVRLDIVARTLAHVEQRYEAAPTSGSRDDREELAHAIQDAQESLFWAERAVASWENGDPRGWARVRPCLAANLVRVDSALAALGWLPPPGLTQIVVSRPPQPCSEAALVR